MNFNFSDRISQDFMKGEWVGVRCWRLLKSLNSVADALALQSSSDYLLLNLKVPANPPRHTKVSFHICNVEMANQSHHHAFVLIHNKHYPLKISLSTLLYILVIARTMSSPLAPPLHIGFCKCTFLSLGASSPLFSASLLSIQQP